MGLFSAVNIDGGLIKGTLDGVGGLLTTIREVITGEASPEKKLAALQKIDEMEQQIKVGNLEVNKLEAQNANLFVSGWRPALGWICDIAIGVYYIPRFILGMIFWCMACWKANTLMPMPEMGIMDILGLVGTLLGAATLRTVEHVKGVATK